MYVFSCLRVAFVLAHVISFLYSQNLSDPTTGIFRPEMQETPPAPDVSSQVVSAPPSQPSSTSPPQYDTLSNVPA